MTEQLEILGTPEKRRQIEYCSIIVLHNLGWYWADGHLICDCNYQEVPIWSSMSGQVMHFDSCKFDCPVDAGEGRRVAENNLVKSLLSDGMSCRTAIVRAMNRNSQKGVGNEQ